MAQQRLAPDALLEQTNLTGSVANIQDDPDSPDANWLVASANNVNTVARTSFGTPTNPPTVGAGLQEFRVRVRKFSTNSGTPTAIIELYENGSLIASGSSTNITSTTGQVISFTWDASSLGTSDGSLVECRVTTTAAGGSPSNRNSVDIGAVEWNADTTALAAQLAGDSHAVAGASGPLTTQIPLIGASLVITASSADLTTAGGAAALEGNAQSQAASSAQLSTAIPLFGTAADVTFASGNFTAKIQLNTTAIAQALASALLTTGIPLGGNGMAQAGASAGLSTQIKLLTAAVMSASASGSLGTAIHMLGSAVGNAAATGALGSPGAALEGDAQAQPGASAMITVQIRFNAAALAQAAAAAGLTSGINLGSNSAGQAGAGATLTASIKLSTDALAQAIATGQFALDVLLFGDAATTASGIATLTVNPPLGRDKRFIANKGKGKLEHSATIKAVAGKWRVAANQHGYRIAA